MRKKPQPQLWLDSARGVYIPRDFATSFADRAKAVTGVTDEQWVVLEAGPDHDDYLETWVEVEGDPSVRVTLDGVTYKLHQDQDLWLIPYGMEWDDDYDEWRWPDTDYRDRESEEYPERGRERDEWKHEAAEWQRLKR